MAEFFIEFRPLPIGWAIPGFPKTKHHFRLLVVKGERNLRCKTCGRPFFPDSQALLYDIKGLKDWKRECIDRNTGIKKYIVPDIRLLCRFCFAKGRGEKTHHRVIIGYIDPGKDVIATFLKE